MSSVTIFAFFGAILLTIPSAFVLVWWLHIRQSRRHPQRMGTYGWILILAPPALIAGLYWVLNTVTDRRNGAGRPAGSLDVTVEDLAVQLWAGQLLVGWLFSLAAEIPTARMRERLSSARATAPDQDAAVAPQGGGALERESVAGQADSPAHNEAATGGGGAARRMRTMPPFAAFAVGAVSAVIGVWPHLPGIREPGSADYGPATGPQLLLPFGDLGGALQVSYGLMLTGAGLAAMVLRFARDRYPGTDARAALWGVLAVQGIALLQTTAILVRDGRADGSTAGKVIGTLVWMALGARVFRLVALRSRATALVGLAFVAAGSAGSIFSWPVTRITGSWLLGPGLDQLWVSGPLLGIAIVWAGFDTVGKVQASAVAVGINWILCSGLAALWALGPEWGTRTWGGEFVANLLAPANLFFTIAVPMAVAAVGLAFRQSIRR